jgi:thiosulfate reductase cytochrome b subunit
LALGSWLLALGSWHLALGFWLLAFGIWHLACEQLTKTSREFAQEHESRIKKH